MEVKRNPNDTKLDNKTRTLKIAELLEKVHSDAKYNYDLRHIISLRSHSRITG